MKVRISLLLLFVANFVFSQSYHDTQGKLEISNSGQATYTLPIALPPSISSVGPTINITYASGQNGGIAGQGFNISGISYISRIATRLDIDGFKDGVDFDDNDKLALEGQRLLLVASTGNYWDDGSVYQTEVQSNSKIELKGTGNSIYFIVTSPDGSRSWYGNYGGMNATDISAYYIVRYEDANGNFILYNYSKPLNKSLCIETIQFSANINSNQTPLNRIEFKYMSAARSEKGYFKGTLMDKSELLYNIKVFTKDTLLNDALFKEYRIGHTTDPQFGYQRVTQIREYNWANEQANPVVFEYDTTTSGLTKVDAPLDSFIDDKDINSGIKFSGDFNGDGRLDLIYDNVLYMKKATDDSYIKETLPFVVDSRKTFLGTMGQQYQSVINTTENMDNLVFEIVYIQPSQYWSYAVQKTITLDNSASYDPNSNSVTDGDGVTTYGNPITGCDTNAVTKSSNEYLEGDFNGDGISEVLVYTTINEKYHYIQTLNEDNQPINPLCNKTFSNDGKGCYLLDLNPAASNILGDKGYLQLSNSFLLQGDKKFVNDYNGDGKSDVLVINNDGRYKIIGFKQLLVAPWVELELLGEGILNKYSTNKQTLFGDFNGDGKIDIIVPEASGDGCEDDYDCTLWYIYYGIPNVNSISFSTGNTYSITAFMPKREYHQSLHYNSYFAIDVNKDGKTDLVRFETQEEYDSDFHDWRESWRVHTFINNIGNSNGTYFINDLITPFSNDTHRIGSTTPFFGSMKFNSGNSDLMVFYHYPCNDYCSLPNQFVKYCDYYRFDKNHLKDYSISKVTQSNGAIVDDIVYNPLISGSSNSGRGLPTDFYSTTNSSLYYPYAILRNSPTVRLVSAIQNTTLGIKKIRLFKYQDLVANQNLGIIGFKKVAQSNWFVGDPNGGIVGGKYIMDVTESNPLMKGTIIKQFSVLLDQDELLNFDTNYTNKINQTDYTYSHSTDPITKKYTILLQNQKTTNYLTNVIKETVYNSYTPDYNLPKSVTSNNYLGTTLQGSTLIETEYDLNNCSTCVGSNYYIGRPVTITTTNTAYTKFKKSVQTMDYSNGNIFHNNKNVYFDSSTSNIDPITLVETMTYYSNGLLKDKEVSASGTTVGVNDVTPRKTSYEYDPSNRFVWKITDAEGLVSSNDSFDSHYGTVLQSTNPFGQITVNEYDTWGKRTSITDKALHLTTHYDYNRVGNTFRTTVTKTTENGIFTDGSSSFVEQDVLAREVRRGSKNLNNSWTYADTQYDVFGRKQQTSEPYFEGDSPSQWTIYDYDDYSRPVKVTSYTGKTVITDYHGLTVTVDDSVMSKSKTLDANGQVVITADAPGGTITYSYDASYNLLESNYDGIKTTMNYDNWGRKIYLKETSSDPFNYSYDAYGQLKTEAAPKGTTTYTYDLLSGRIATKSVVGDGTDITSTYNYNQTTKLLDRIDVVNSNDGGSTITYTYDLQRRLTNTEERQYLLPSGTAVFTKDIKYDSFSRVDVETNTASAFGKTSNKAIKHNYYSYNGSENQLTDNSTHANLWWANSVDARGNILTASLGNGIAITNTFDEFGYASQFQHLLGNTNVMTLNTSFDQKLGDLNSRYNSMFDSTENFTYDQQDRLTAWDSSSDTLLLLPFDNGTNNFSFSSSNSSSNLTPGSVSNDTGTLKVILKNGIASRLLPEIPATVGNKYRIKADISNETVLGGTAVMVKAVMVETDPNDSSTSFDVDLGYVQVGKFDSEYTVTDNAATNPILSIKFVIQDDTNNLVQTPINSGGGTTPQATFNIDNLKINWVAATTQNYDDKGRITENKNGYYNYSNDKPYQNISIVPSPDEPLANAFTKAQNITYNAFKAPIQIISAFSNTAVSFGYNSNEQRSAMYYGSHATDKLVRTYRRYYSADGSMEISAVFEADDPSTPVKMEFLTYIGGSAYSAPIVLKSDGENSYNYFYLHRDYQSSILAISNEHGEVVEKRMFDPWGAVTKVQDGAGNNLKQLTFFDRGYTGHEHLQSVGLINMNARLYNPYLHRFLEADNFVKDPSNTQNYNRYGYCLNNPLKYNDLDGNNPMILIGIAVAVISYMTITAINHQQITVGGIITSMTWGFISSGVSFGVGEVTECITSFALEATTASVLHGVTQGALTSMQGGKFWNSFASGSLSSLAASSWTGVSGSFGQSAVGTIAFGTIAGGAGSYLTGGNFWEGAVTGMIVSGFNHALHDDSMVDDNNGDDDKASLKIRKHIVDNAVDELDSTEYAVKNNNGFFGDPKNKCNLFVSDVLSESDASPGTPNGRLGLSPPSAGQWADPNYEIPNWKVVENPRAGDVVARARHYTDATGHVAIMDTKTTSIGAGEFVVHRTAFGYDTSSEFIHTGESYVYRRYYATPQQRFNYQFYNWIYTKRN